MHCLACTLSHFMVTKHAEKSTRCTFYHPFASNTINRSFFPSMCVRMCVFVPVCLCFDVHLSVAARMCPRVCCGVLCYVLLSPPQSVLNWNSVLLWVDYEATAARSSVSCMKYDYRYRDWVKMWFDCCRSPKDIISLFDWMAGMVWGRR